MKPDAREQLSHDLLSCAYKDLTDVQRSVIDLIATEAPTEVDGRLKVDERSRGERLADRVADIGGSWGFIIGFAVALLGWMAWNVLTKGFGLSFDPYPFIFLNLMLSTLAAIQAPIIMMSQNRAAQRDRKAAEHDYLVNLRAELEIMHLHDKVDALREQELLDIIRQQAEALALLRADRAPS
ncbi:DUF1003 domain-containing protein [Phenylobacterium sp. SCN 70-31]|uniref:DUF1003 domain-containing protein n=1 Tax=Phenylobacterium sp. SCN 70-31 TaxID=1660129 RepID=UPI00086BDBE6|nr:DUF1003 domain-containing protein [Phenylobacterium sp. SCN 70-31]ODT88735.1 MAG: hypothetical protein ABS78_06145 [Phenylobacterium sp. SCN 70-31]